MPTPPENKRQEKPEAKPTKPEPVQPHRTPAKPGKNDNPPRGK